VVTASDDKTARVWDAARGRELLRLGGNADLLSGAGFSPDGRRIVTSARDGAVRIWDATTGELLEVYAGHRGDVRTAVFSPDGHRLLTASYDGTVRVWDARVATLKQQLEWTEAAQFDPLSSDDRVALGLAVSAERQYVGRSSRTAPELAKLGEEAYEAAYSAQTPGDRNAHLLEAFRSFALAAAQAESENWADDRWREWRHRRASLARLLARAGMLENVADIFAGITERQAPQ
jgi:hypothetical protein